MPWNLAAMLKRNRVEEAKAPVVILRDVWARQRIESAHVAALHSMVSTMATELTHLRYTVERVHDSTQQVQAKVCEVSDTMTAAGELVRAAVETP